MDDEQHLDAQPMQRRLRQWRQAHPQATFDEIEDAVQEEIARWQAHLLEALLPATPPATPPHEAEAGAAAPPVCRTCGTRMQRAGRRRREVQSRLGQPIRLERDYYVCPACGAGLFPPR